MKKIVYTFFIFFFIVALITTAMGQHCEQKNIHFTHCNRPDGFRYEEYGASRTLTVLKQRTRKIDIPFYQGKDYFISVCAGSNREQVVHFKVVSKDFNQVIYNNQDDDYNSTFTFTASLPVILTIEISVPGNLDRFKMIDSECVGILVYSKDTGF